MIGELGALALWLALAVALVQGSLPLVGAVRGRADWMALARTSAQAQFALVALAFACLAAGFLTHDFSLRYVASHSNRALAPALRFAAMWGGHEGSMLLWLLMQSGWGLAVAQCSRRLPPAFVSRALAVMGLLSAGFLLFVLVTSNPFERLPIPAADGNDLHPVLQHPGMVLHPPMLFMGCVGFSVAFAFAVAALMERTPDGHWARWARPWTAAAWSCLTLGIMLGSWWAYEVLGWGGWWFWDPVENASFMPWLAGTALLHALAATRQRGVLNAWSLLLALAVFSFALLGTLLVRSGVLPSVHAFASDPLRGVVLFMLLVLAAGGALALYAWRAPRWGGGPRFGAVSRESMLLVQNVLFVSAMLAVLLGTVCPLIADALGFGLVMVGPGYFDAVFLSLMAPAAFLMGVGPLARWRHAPVPALARRLKWAAGVSVLAALGAAALSGRMGFVATLGLLMSVWIVATVVADLWARRSQGLSPAAAGMLLAHVGVAVFAFGVSMVKTHGMERDLTMAPGQSAPLAGHVFTLRSVTQVSATAHDVARAVIDVTRDGRAVARLEPQRRVHRERRTATTEPAIDRGITGDVYVSLGEAVAGGAWIVRLHHKPFVSWIWGGCMLMALGGLVAAGQRRQRVAHARSTQGSGVAPA